MALSLTVPALVEYLPGRWQDPVWCTRDRNILFGTNWWKVGLT